jgi:hypothetical protein
MTDRPTLFSGPMVRAIIEGRKTQTRRVLRGVDPTDRLRESPFVASGVETAHGNAIRIPYRPDDRLWVREKSHWNGWDPAGEWETAAITYAADGQTLVRRVKDAGIQRPYRSFDFERKVGWLTPIHMPRWASRITLTVTDVRVQRLQEISEEDAIAEGIRRVETDPGKPPMYEYHGNHWLENADGSPAVAWLSARDSYRHLWDSLNDKRGFGWDVNPWVVAISFRPALGDIDAIREAA